MTNVHSIAPIAPAGDLAYQFHLASAGQSRHIRKR